MTPALLTPALLLHPLAILNTGVPRVGAMWRAQALLLHPVAIVKTGVPRVGAVWRARTAARTGRLFVVVATLGMVGRGGRD